MTKVATIIYAWSDTRDSHIIKFGDHSVPFQNETYPSEQEINKHTLAYIRRKQLGREGDRWENGRITVHFIRDITEYAKSIGKNYVHSKIDDYITNITGLRHHRNKNKIDRYTIDIDTLNRYVNQAISGKANINSYRPHLFQQEAITKATDYYNSLNSKTPGNFLLDCVMRFGKCFTSYQIARSIDARRILVITGRPKVKDGWRDDLDHVDFAEWRFIDSQTETDVKFSARRTNTEVIFASFQGGVRDDSRIEQVINQQIDLVIVDEAHAYFSQDAIDFVKTTLQAKNRLWVSGTPFKAYESGMFDGVTDTYRFTLVDLLRTKQLVETAIKNGDEYDLDLARFTEFPNIQFLVAEYPDYSQSLNINKIVQEDQSLNMKSLLSNRAGVTNYPTEVQQLLNTLMGSGHRNRSVLEPARRGSNRARYPVTANHVWMAVPAGRDDDNTISVASAVTLEREILKHPTLGKMYQPLTIRGDKNQDDVNRHITLAKLNIEGKNRTINISCRSLNTGTKFPDLDTVVFLTETSSASEFWQTVGRVLQPNSGKESVTVVCYSIEMMVTMVNKMVEYSATANTAHNKLCQEFLDMAPVFTMNSDVGLRELSVTDLYTTLSSRGSARQAFSDREVLSDKFDQLVLSDPDFFSEIPDVNSDSDPNRIVVASSGKRGKNSITTRNGGSGKTVDIVRDSRERVREFLKQIGSVIAAGAVYDGSVITSANDLRSISKKTATIIDNELYPGTVNIINHLIDVGALNRGILDRKIGAFYQVEIEPMIEIK